MCEVNTVYCTLGDLSCPYDDDYRCPSDGACIRSYQLCDGIIDCDNLEDELNCSCKLLCSVVQLYMFTDVCTYIRTYVHMYMHMYVCMYVLYGTKF